jgi:hypothetical protein
MADLQLSDTDIDYIARVVATEVPLSVRRNPMEYNRMVGAVVDTVTNRLASGKYGNSVSEVLNERRAFSKITGPKRLSPYGSVQAAPAAPKSVRNAVNDHIAARAKGKKSEIGGALDYANPNHSDRSNLRGWINPMIARGATMLGLGNAVHFHGLAPGNKPAPDYDLKAPDGFMPSLGDSMRRQTGAPIPDVKPNRTNAMMAEARSFDRGGLVDSPKISLNPVSSAQAGELYNRGGGSRNDARPMPVTRAPLPSIRDTRIPADQAERNAPIRANQIASMFNRGGGVQNDMRPMPSGPIQQKPTEPKGYQAYARARLAAMEAPKPAPSTLTPDMAAQYANYGASRMAAPIAPPQSMPAMGPEMPAMRPQVQGPVTGEVQVEGPMPQRTKGIPRQAPKFGQEGWGKNIMQDTGAGLAGATLGSLLGPAGTVIGGLLGRDMMNGRQGQKSLLAGLLGGGSPSWNGSTRNVGSGVNAVSQAMWGGRGGDTANYSSQGGGTVTNLGNGGYTRHSDQYGWTETTHPDGNVSISYDRDKGSKKRN